MPGWKDKMTVNDMRNMGLGMLKVYYIHLFLPGKPQL